ncbi:MAG: hypothetical protein AB8C13_07510 [Phycisphaerales bacterium]
MNTKKPTNSSSNSSSNSPATDSTTWASLLSGWIQFAQSAVALPDDAEGDRWRDSIAPAIGLHAIAMALAELYKLDPAERPLAMDKAELGIKEHAKSLNEAWNAEPMPESLQELFTDARNAWEDSLHEGVVWRCGSERFISRHPGEIGLAMREAGFMGEVFVSAPGIEMFKDAPVAWCRDQSGGMPDEQIVEFVHGFLETCKGELEHPEIVRPLHQVYRQMDFMAGGPSHDLVAPVTGDLPSGQPLLVPVVVGGEVCSVSLPPKSGKPLDPIPVKWATVQADESTNSSTSDDD